jgi:hypothetical protein
MKLRNTLMAQAGMLALVLATKAGIASDLPPHGLPSGEGRTNHFSRAPYLQLATPNSMVVVMTPERCGTTTAEAQALRDHLLFSHHIEVQSHARAGRVWVRVCAQAYNEMRDIERLAAAVGSYRS